MSITRKFYRKQCSAILRVDHYRPFLDIEFRLIGILKWGHLSIFSILSLSVGTKRTMENLRKNGNSSKIIEYRRFCFFCRCNFETNYRRNTDFSTDRLTSEFINETIFLRVWAIYGNCRLRG